MDKPVIIFFHFAGGNSYSLKQIYDEFKEYNVYAAELPGRGRKLNEKLLTSATEAKEYLLKQLLPIINSHSKFYLLGHSMGALLAFLVAQLLRDLRLKEPEALFVLGRGGPSGSYLSKKCWDLPKEEFKAVLRKLGGCPEEILQNNELFAFFEPIIRADFELIQSYDYKKKYSLNIPIVGFYGTKDETSETDMLRWKEETNSHFELYTYPGRHFFIFEFSDEVINDIKNFIKDQSLL